MSFTLIKRNSVYVKRCFKSVRKGWVTQYCTGNTGYSFKEKALSYVCGISCINFLKKDMNIKMKNIKSTYNLQVRKTDEPYIKIF